MHRAVKTLLAATLVAAAGLAAAKDDSPADNAWLADPSAGQGSFAAGAQAEDLSSTWSEQHVAADSGAPSPAYALTLTGLAMIGALVRRRRRDTF